MLFYNYPKFPSSWKRRENFFHAWKEDCRTRRCAIFHHRFPAKEKEQVCVCIYIYVYTNEIFILAGADAHRESRMGGTVRAADVQRWRGHVSYDPAQKATRRKLLEACSRNYQRFFEHAEENRPHFRPLCRHGDSFLGPEEVVSVSTRNSLSLVLTFSFSFFVEVNCNGRYRLLEKINRIWKEIRGNYDILYWKYERFLILILIKQFYLR